MKLSANINIPIGCKRSKQPADEDKKSVHVYGHHNFILLLIF